MINEMEAYYLRKYEETGDANYLQGVSPENMPPKKEDTSPKDLSEFFKEQPAQV